MNIIIIIAILAGLFSDCSLAPPKMFLYGRHVKVPEALLSS